MHNYSDLESCIDSLKSYNAAFFTRPAEEGGTEVICYSPYLVHNSESGELEVRCYVYNWIDRYDANGQFVDHYAYEGVITEELDENI